MTFLSTFQILQKYTENSKKKGRMSHGLGRLSELIRNDSVTEKRFSALLGCNEIVLPYNGPVPEAARKMREENETTKSLLPLSQCGFIRQSLREQYNYLLKLLFVYFFQNVCENRLKFVRERNIYKID